MDFISKRNAGLLIGIGLGDPICLPQQYLMLMPLVKEQNWLVDNLVFMPVGTQLVAQSKISNVGNGLNILHGGINYEH